MTGAGFGPRITRALASGAVALLVTVPPTAMGQQPVRPVALLAPTTGSWLGAYVKDGTPQNDADRERMITGLESSIGRKLGIDHHYFGFKDLIASDLTQWDVKNGRIPLISWQATDSVEVRSGKDDGWIRTQAKAVKALKAPVFIRYGWEPDLAQNADWVHAPEDYIAAWQHLHDLFGKAGATNVAWVWCPTSFSFTSGNAFPYYPGDAYVDWDCADGYNWSPGRPGNPWRLFAQIFDSFFQWGAGTGKPLMIAETGAQERGPGEQASWIADMRSTVKARYPDLEALVYFDSNARYDWRVNTSPQSLSAFTALARDPYFNPTAWVGPCPASGPTGDVPCVSAIGIVYPPSTSPAASSTPTTGPGQAIGGAPDSRSKPGHLIDPWIVIGILVAAAFFLVIAFRTWLSNERTARSRDRGH